MWGFPQFRGNSEVEQSSGFLTCTAISSRLLLCPLLAERPASLSPALRPQVVIPSDSERLLTIYLWVGGKYGSSLFSILMPILVQYKGLPCQTQREHSQQLQLKLAHCWMWQNPTEIFKTPQIASIAAVNFLSMTFLRNQIQLKHAIQEALVPWPKC